MRILFWDIELRPMKTYTWTLWPDSIPISFIIETQKTLCWGARWYGEKRVRFMSENDGYQNMLDGIHGLLDEADAVVSWNGKNFDSKHMRREFTEAGMEPPSPWREIDLMQAVKSQMRFASNKLDHVAEQLGVGKKVPTNMQLWLDCMGVNGEEAKATAWRKMERYQKQDVNLLVDLYDRLLPWIPNHPNVSLYNSVLQGCTHCGSTDVVKRGFSYTNAGIFQRYRCNSCGAWSKDPKRLGTVELRST